MRLQPIAEYGDFHLPKYAGEISFGVEEVKCSWLRCLPRRRLFNSVFIYVVKINQPRNGYHRSCSNRKLGERVRVLEFV